MHVRIHRSLEEIDAVPWNQLAGDHNPFLRHEFLATLERHGCVGKALGWLPRPLAAYDDDGRLLGAAPMYLKTHSYGELVFDWAWADAYQRAGLPYYPKLVVAIPYTPATGKRLLLRDGENKEPVADGLIQAALHYASEHALSSVHWLFPTADDTQRLERHGLLRRIGCQFHWENPGYRDFDDFLDSFTAQKRKKLKRERRRVREADIEIRVLQGGEVSDPEWQSFHELYCATFYRRGGIPTLSLGFFKEIAQTMADAVVLVLARHHHRIVGAAFNMRGGNTLYGRHWGCFEAFHSLHFEACYYVGLDYCIRHGLQRFEPGAQGEYKLSRGFLPTPTWSAHWLAHPQFRHAIDKHLHHEAEGMSDYMQELAEHSPYKQMETG